MKAVPSPKFEESSIEPFTKEEVEALLKACEQCNEAKTTNRRKYLMRRATGRRDQAIIMTLLDTGLRASELSALKVGDVDLETGKVQVTNGCADMLNDRSASVSEYARDRLAHKRRCTVFA